jgi:hypothetical protein
VPPAKPGSPRLIPHRLAACNIRLRPPKGATSSANPSIPNRRSAAPGAIITTPNPPQTLPTTAVLLARPPHPAKTTRPPSPQHPRPPVAAIELQLTGARGGFGVISD